MGPESRGKGRIHRILCFASQHAPPATNTSPLPPPNTLAFAKSGLLPIVCVASTRTPARAFFICLGGAAGSGPHLKQLRGCVALPTATKALMGRPALTGRPGAAISVLAMFLFSLRVTWVLHKSGEQMLEHLLR